MASHRYAVLGDTELIALVTGPTGWHRFKAVGAELERRAIGVTAADGVIDAFRSGQLPPWLTAYLLGCTRAPQGYIVAREILRAAPRSLAESYAGVAMAKIAGGAAYEDLASLMVVERGRDVREGAAWGLGALERPESVVLFQRAMKEARIRRACAAANIARCPNALAFVFDWFGDPDVELEALAFDVAMTLVRRRGAAPHDRLVRALRGSLAGGRVRVSPSARRLLDAL